jgi:hypothetical protein
MYEREKWFWCSLCYTLINFIATCFVAVLMWTECLNSAFWMRLVYLWCACEVRCAYWSTSFSDNNRAPQTTILNFASWVYISGILTAKIIISFSHLQNNRTKVHEELNHLCDRRIKKSWWLNALRHSQCEGSTCGLEWLAKHSDGFVLLGRGRLHWQYYLLIRFIVHCSR